MTDEWEFKSDWIEWRERWVEGGGPCDVRRWWRCTERIPSLPGTGPSSTSEIPRAFRAARVLEDVRTSEEEEVGAEEGPVRPLAADEDVEGEMESW